jgi:TonB family protein
VSPTAGDLAAYEVEEPSRCCWCHLITMDMARPAAMGVLFLALPIIGVPQSGQPENDTSRVFVVADAKRPTKTVQPLYPESAKSDGIQGTVVVDIVVGKTGEVERVQPISGPKEIWSASVDAVKQWKWEPFLLNGNPIRVRTKAMIRFVLDASHSLKSLPAPR